MNNRDKQSLADGTLGQILARARKDRGLSVTNVCDQLRLSATRIHAIEKDQYLQDEVNVFTRGHVKSYAKFLGICEDVVRNAFTELGIEYERSRTIQAEPSEAVTLNDDPKIKKKLISSKFLIYASVILSVILCAWYVYNYNSNTGVTKVSINNKLIKTTNLSANSKATVISANDESLSANNLSEDVDHPLISSENINNVTSKLSNYH